MDNNPATEDLLFEVLTPLGFNVRVTRAYWEMIVTIKHPVMLGHESDVKEIIVDPAEILKWYRFCAVIKRTNGNGFLITTYPTDSIKEGEHIWPK